MEFDLTTALERFPLPEEIADEVINRGQCARALDVTEPMITKYLEQGLPVLSRGSNGTAYEFQTSHVYAWKRARDEYLQERRDAAERASAQLALAFRGADADAEGEDVHVLTARQVREESEADFQRNRAAEYRGELVRAARVRVLFEEVLGEFRNQIVAVVDYCEMEFGLTSDQVAKLQRRCDNTLVTARMKFGEAVPGEIAHLSEHARSTTETPAKAQPGAER